MTKKKPEAQLLKLCGSKGAITVFQGNVNALLSGNTEDRDHCIMLLEMIVLVTRLQDKHMKMLTKIKEGLKIENPELFRKFGRFYATVKICGRDCHKSTKHHSFVSNQARLRKLKIGKTIHYSPTNSNIYLSSEFNRGLLSLGHVKELKDKGSTGEFQNLMMKDIGDEIKSFIINNGKVITQPLF